MQHPHTDKNVHRKYLLSLSGQHTEISAFQSVHRKILLPASGATPQKSPQKKVDRNIASISFRATPIQQRLSKTAPLRASSYQNRSPGQRPANSVSANRPFSSIFSKPPHHSPQYFTASASHPSTSRPFPRPKLWPPVLPIRVWCGTSRSVSSLSIA